MAWGEVELEPEVRDWLAGLTDREFGHVERYVDLLAEEGVALREPQARHLGWQLCELRFYLARQQIRIPHFIAPGHRIILLTVFRKARQRERAEIERARRAMERCILEQHSAGDD